MGKKTCTVYFFFITGVISPVMFAVNKYVLSFQKCGFRLQHVATD